MWGGRKVHQTKRKASTHSQINPAACCQVFQSRCLRRAQSHSLHTAYHGAQLTFRHFLPQGGAPRFRGTNVAFGPGMRLHQSFLLQQAIRLLNRVGIHRQISRQHATGGQFIAVGNGAGSQSLFDVAHELQVDRLPFRLHKVRKVDHFPAPFHLYHSDNTVSNRIIYVIQLSVNRFT